MSSQPALDEFAEAAAGLTGRACSAALAKLHRIIQAQPAAKALGEAAPALERSTRIKDCLEAAHDALLCGDEDSAALEWARAQVLLVEMNRGLAETPAPAYQKSGTAR